MKRLMKIIDWIKKRVLVRLYYKSLYLAKKVRYGYDRFDIVEIETNSICNFGCKYCPVSTHRREKGEMPTETYKKVILELAEMGFNGIISPHFYNEPFTDKRLYDLMQFTKDKLPKARIVIYTNGSHMDHELFKRFDHLVDRYVLSQHTPEMLPNIKKLYAALSEKEKKKIEYVIYHSPDAKLMNRGGLVESQNIQKFYYCIAPIKFLTINYKGEVILCCNDYFSKHVFGNVNKERVLDIWKKQEFINTRKEIINGNFKFSLCRKCSQTEKGQ